MGMFLINIFSFLSVSVTLLKLTAFYIPRKKDLNTLNKFKISCCLYQFSTSLSVMNSNTSFTAEAMQTLVFYVFTLV